MGTRDSSLLWRVRSLFWKRWRASGWDVYFLFVLGSRKLCDKQQPEHSEGLQLTDNR